MWKAGGLDIKQLARRWEAQEEQGSRQRTPTQTPTRRSSSQSQRAQAANKEPESHNWQEGSHIGEAKNPGPWPWVTQPPNHQVGHRPPRTWAEVVAHQPWTREPGNHAPGWSREHAQGPEWCVWHRTGSEHCRGARKGDLPPPHTPWRPQRGLPNRHRHGRPTPSSHETDKHLSPWECARHQLHPPKNIVGRKKRE